MWPLRLVLLVFGIVDDFKVNVFHSRFESWLKLYRRPSNNRFFCLKSFLMQKFLILYIISFSQQRLSNYFITIWYQMFCFLWKINSVNVNDLFQETKMQKKLLCGNWNMSKLYTAFLWVLGLLFLFQESDKWGEFCHIL